MALVSNHQYGYLNWGITPSVEEPLGLYGIFIMYKPGCSEGAGASVEHGFRVD